MFWGATISLALLIIFQIVRINIFGPTNVDQELKQGLISLAMQLLTILLPYLLFLQALGHPSLAPRAKQKDNSVEVLSNEIRYSETHPIRAQYDPHSFYLEAFHTKKSGVLLCPFSLDKKHPFKTKFIEWSDSASPKVAAPYSKGQATLKDSIEKHFKSTEEGPGTVTIRLHPPSSKSGQEAQVGKVENAFHTLKTFWADFADAELAEPLTAEGEEDDPNTKYDVVLDTSVEKDKKLVLEPLVKKKKVSSTGSDAGST